MRNLTLREFCVVFAVLVLMTALGPSLGEGFRIITQIGWVALVAERGHNLGRVQTAARLRREFTRCGQNLLGDVGHECVRRTDDGHTMHRCAHGDCEWGHY